MVTRVVVIGAGPIGARVAHEIASRPSLSLCGVVDVDPAKLGSDVAGVKVAREIPEADVAALTTTSSLAKLVPLALDVIARKMHVVSTCEELAWPWSQPDLARTLDDAAQKHGVAVLGTGVNPGFVMDALPLFLTAPASTVEKVRVERVQDASPRRRPFQDKVGVGLEQPVVEQGLAARTLGHVGLKESAAMLAARLGFAVDDFREDFKVVTAAAPVTKNGRTVDAGRVLGVEQVGTASASGRVVVELFFRAVFGEAESFDRVAVDGTPALDVTVKGGVPGDVATAAIVANAVRSVVDAKPGVRTMADVPLVAFSR